MATSPLGNSIDNPIDVDQDEMPLYEKASEPVINPPSTISPIPQGQGSGLNADQLDGYNASTYANPAPNTLVPTGPSGLLPTSIVPSVSGPPTGVAGGALAGNYPNPTIASTGVAPGTYGDGTHTSQITINAAGQITSANSQTITNAPPSGAASGDLAGTYPSPTLAVISTAGTHGDSTHVAQITIDNKGRVTTLADVAIASAPPTGSAGGDLTGTYPNPTLINTAVTPGTYGDSSHIPQVTFDSKGRATSAVSIALTGAAPTGTAGGDLSGTYPNPALAGTGVDADTYGGVNTIPIIAINAKGQAVLATDIPIVMTGDATIAGTTVTLANSGVTAGTYGNAANYVQATIDSKGRITNIGNIIDIRSWKMLGGW